MKVRITHLAPVNSGEKTASYIVNSEADCRDAHDRSVYQMVVMLPDVWTCGKTIAEPVKAEDEALELAHRIEEARIGNSEFLLHS